MRAGLLANLITWFNIICGTFQGYDSEVASMPTVRWPPRPTSWPPWPGYDYLITGYPRPPKPLKKENGNEYGGTQISILNIK